MRKLQDSDCVFKKLSEEQVKTIVKKYDSPCFIIDEKSLITRTKIFKETVKNYYKNSTVAYSVKTQPLPGTIKRLYKLGYVPEVVSSDEFSLINELQLTDQGLIFNGPYKRDDTLIQAIKLQAKINCDHYDEILRIAKLVEKHHLTANIGLRIVDVKDSANWSRFGFGIDNIDSNAELFKVIDQIKNLSGINFSGLHCHIGTNIRDFSRFRRISQNIAKIAKMIEEKYGQILDWIDVGGGICGVSPRWDEDRIEPHPQANIQQYVETIFEPLKKYLHQSGGKTELIFEPGRTIFDFTTALLANVVGCRHKDQRSQTLIVNAGIHTVPTTLTYRHPVYHFKSDNNDKLTRLLGPTCMQHDVLSDDLYIPSLEYGDFILMDCIGAYNTSRNNEFIHLKPSIILLTENNEYQILRKKPSSFITENKG